MKNHSTLIRKSFLGMAFAALLLLSYSCVPDSSSEDVNGDAALKAVEAKGKKARPIKAQLNFDFDFVNTPPGDITLCTGGLPIPLFQSLISGNVSHLGKLQPGQSFEDLTREGSLLIPESCDSTGFPNSVNSIETVYSGVYVAANGDELYTIERVTISFTSLPDTSVGTFSGIGEVIGGSGRFADAEGTWELIGGTFASGSASWEMEGEITY